MNVSNIFFWIFNTSSRHEVNDNDPQDPGPQEPPVQPPPADPNAMDWSGNNDWLAADWS